MYDTRNTTSSADYSSEQKSQDDVAMNSHLDSHTDSGMDIGTDGGVDISSGHHRSAKHAAQFSIRPSSLRGGAELPDELRRERRLTASMLGQTVESEIIPMLFHNHRVVAPRADLTRPKINNRTATERAPSSTKLPSPIDTSTASGWLSPEAFSAMVLGGDEDAALRHVFTVRNQGVSDEVLLLDLLAPTSRLLGEMWEADTCNFTDVTVGVCRLHRILRWLHPDHERSPQRYSHGGRVALAPVPGEQHSFGLLMVSDFLHRSGWTTEVDIHAERGSIIDTVRRNWYDMMCLSASAERLLDKADRLIDQIRDASCNESIIILIGGRVFNDNAELATELGADHTAVDGRDAARLAASYRPVNALATAG